MAKEQMNTILVASVTALAVAGAVILLHRKFNKNYTKKRIAKFIENPDKLASPDDPESWKKVNVAFLSKLEKISRDYGSKLKINSGYRTQTHNTSVGGVSNSAHLRGNAVDISTGSYENSIRLAKIAKRHGFNRMGIGNTFIHLDMDTTLPIARWTYQGVNKTEAERAIGFA